MPRHRKYYIETSSVHKTGNELKNKVPASECFTSAFVLFELVTHLDKSDCEFRVRKACVANLLELEESGLHVEWMLPKDRGKAAFPYLGHKPDHMGRFFQLVQCVRECECWQEFVELLACRGLDAYFIWLNREHADIIDAAMRLRPEPSVPAETDALVEKLYPMATTGEKRATRNEVFRGLPRHHTARGRTIRSFAREWARECIPAASERVAQRILDSYDGSIALFIEGLDIALAKCMVGRHSVEPNDFADLLHLMYLRDGDVLVSEEGRNKLVTSVAHEIGVSVKHIDELKS